MYRRAPETRLDQIKRILHFQESAIIVIVVNGQTVFQYQKGKFASEKIILSRTSRDLKGGLEIKAKNGPLRMDNV